MFKVKRYKSISEREDELTKWWKEKKIFERSVEERPEDNQFSFLDGPPFVTGLPHYGHLVGRIAKDVIPRFQTMKGKKVRRIWGWDCHGLPIEERVEKKLGLENKKDIEEFGVNKFLRECENYVNDVSSEWEWYVDKIAEWIDFENSYKTMNQDYMESVIWVFKQLYEKDLLYKGSKTLLYCTRCGTPVSKFEIAMDDSYKDMEDPAVTVSFPITTKGEFKNVNLLAWTTTPWTLPSNRALVVAPKETYVLFSKEDNDDKYICAQKRLEEVTKHHDIEVIEKFKGEKLEGLEYSAPFNYFPPNKKDFRVYSYKDMVTMEEGTGIVHSAPGFGEIDTQMGEEIGLTMMYSVDDEGKFIDKVEDYKGMYVKKADKKIIKDLKDKNLLFKFKKIVHRYPYCYRCKTPLIQRAQKGWFINIDKIKPLLKENSKKINWVPEKLRSRFENNLKEAPDWNISRSRYWATVIPVWQCDECDHEEVFGSIEEIENRSEQNVTSLHRNGVDHIEFKCKKCDGTMKRISEVLDVWLDSASMPYGQIHYPFENKELFKNTFPGDYIIEYVAQIRAWFYVMHVISNALFEKNSFVNCVVTGTMAGNDGRKMSKSLGNYPDPKDTLIKFGGDAIRLYFMSSKIMLGEDPSFDENELRAQVNQVIFPLWNSAHYFATYANLHKWKPEKDLLDSTDNKLETSSKLDLWILAKLKNFNKTVEENLSKYNMPQATRAIAPFVDDISTWYIRRSRDRFVNADENALTTLYYVLIQTAKTIAPITPFIAESLYKALVVNQFEKVKESIHLTFWKDFSKTTKFEDSLIKQMATVREIASLGQAARVENQLKVRQPLSKVTVFIEEMESWMEEILLDELNVKDIEYKEAKSTKPKVELDTKLTPELKEEGLMREIARKIQANRKKLGFEINDIVTVFLETDSLEIKKVVKNFQKELCEQTNSSSVELDSADKEIKINDFDVKIRISKDS